MGRKLIKHPKNQKDERKKPASTLHLWIKKILNKPYACFTSWAAIEMKSLFKKVFFSCVQFTISELVKLYRRLVSLLGACFLFGPNRWYLAPGLYILLFNRVSVWNIIWFSFWWLWNDVLGASTTRRPAPPWSDQLLRKIATVRTYY